MRNFLPANFMFLNAILLVILLSCKKDSDSIAIQSITYYGCDKTKSVDSFSESSGCAYFQLDKNTLLISRSNVLLNCAADSFSVDISSSENRIDVYESFEIKTPAYCNCSKNYDYSIGKLSKSVYSVYLHTPSNTVINFVVDSTHTSGKICL